MVDAQSNIKVSIDTADALASIKNLQRQISTFHQSMAKSGAAANAVTNQMQQNLINSINATGQFSAQMKTIRTSTESFTNSLEKNKFSLGEYFRYAGGASKTFGKLFKTEFETINKVARENVKDLQTQYIKLGRDANGAMKSIAVRPLALDMKDLSTQTMIASQKQALLNQLLKQGSTNLLNFGKNTQWAGRQLMVGFTLPLLTLGSAASKTFMDLEAQAIRFKKVYGDLFTAPGDSQAALDSIKELGKEFTKYGVALSDTVGLAAEAAAAGFEGIDLQRQTTAATRLSILGQIDNQKALETTISLQNAFSMSSDKLAESIDFLNAVENQTVVSLDDITTAIPKVAPVIQQLGGDVKDLAFFMTAMKEGGINASEGANALKSGLASMINPTGKAVDMLSSFGINIKAIVQDNKGDLKKTVVEFATALNQLDPLNRAQAIEQMFGKFQFARLSTLFANVAKDGNQAARVLDLANSSVQDLAALSEKELGLTAESSMVKFKAAVENLKITLIPLGEEFLKAVTPILGFISNILDKFNNLGDGTKKAIVIITGAVAGLGPILLMTFGLLANGVANIIKGFTFLKSVFNKTGSATHLLGTQVEYMTLEQRNALAVGASLDQVHNNLAQTFSSERAAVDALTKAYQRSVAAQSQFMPTAVPIGRGPIKKRAKGKPAVVGGTGNRDSELALLMPGETVIPTAMSKKYGSLINGMIADNIPGYMAGKISSDTVASHIEGLTPAQLVATLSDPVMQKVLESLPDAKVGLQRLSTTTDGMVTVSKTIETSLKNLADTLAQNNIKDATAVGTGGFAGTTIEASSDRNLMLNAAGVAGDPITFEQMQAASGKAQSYLDKPVKNETAAVKAQREEAQKLIQEQLKFEKSLAGLSEQDVEVRKTDFTKRKTTQALEYALMQKGLSASEASALAKQQIANAEKSVLKLVQGSKTDLEKRKIKEAAYQATLLKEMNLVAGYDEKNTKTTVFNKTQLNAVPRDMAKGQMQFGTPYKPGQEVPSDAAVFGSGKSFMGLSGRRVKRNQSAVVDASIRDDYYSDRARAKNNFKEGSNNAKAYRKGVQAAKIPDIYEESRKRKSPHPLAPKDGKDDARAYNKARDKELTQSGKKRRVSQRPQGPAPIGPIIPAGTQELTIIPKPTKGELRKDRMRKTSTKLLGKAKSTGRLGGGIGLLGASMAAQALPESTATTMAQTTLQFAAMGAMFGPWGAAAGAAFGLVSSGISILKKRQEELLASSRATYSPSAGLAEYFGNTVALASTKLNNFNVVIKQTGTEVKNLGSSTSTTTKDLNTFIQAVESLPDIDPLKIIIDTLTKEENISNVKRMAQEFIMTQVALGSIKPDQAQQTLDLILASSNHLGMVGSNFVNFASQADAVTQLLKRAASGSTDVGQALINVGAAARNATSMEDLVAILDAITNSGLNATFAMESLYRAYGRVGNTSGQNLIDALEGIEGANVQTVVAIQTALSKGIDVNIDDASTLESIMAEINAGYERLGKKAFETTRKISSANDAQIKQNDSNIKALEKRKKILEEALKKEQGITKEISRQNDYLNKQQDLDQKIAEAKMSGNYLEAAALGQEKIANSVEYAKNVKMDKIQNDIEKIDVQIQAIQDNTTALNNLTTKLGQTGTGGTGGTGGGAASGGGTLGINKQIFQPPKSDQLETEAGFLGLGPDTAYMIFKNPATEELVQFKSNVNSFRTDYKNMLGKYYVFERYSKYNIPVNKAKLYGSQNEVPNAAFPNLEGLGPINPGPPDTTKKQKKVKAALGGHIIGPGTATSDSIPALLSNGEYVIKAKSVAKYGTGFMDKVNAGKFAEGGMVPGYKDGTPGGVTDNFMNRPGKDYVFTSSFAKSPFSGNWITKEQAKLEQDQANDLAKTLLKEITGIPSLGRLATGKSERIGDSFLPGWLAKTLGVSLDILGAIPLAGTIFKLPKIGSVIAKSGLIASKTKVPTAAATSVKPPVSTFPAPPKIVNVPSDKLVITDEMLDAVYVNKMPAAKNMSESLAQKLATLKQEEQTLLSFTKGLSEDKVTFLNKMLAYSKTQDWANSDINTYFAKANELGIPTDTFGAYAVNISKRHGNVQKEAAFINSTGNIAKQVNSPIDLYRGTGIPKFGSTGQTPEEMSFLSGLPQSIVEAALAGKLNTLIGQTVKSTRAASYSEDASVAAGFLGNYGGATQTLDPLLLQIKGFNGKTIPLSDMFGSFVGANSVSNEAEHLVAPTLKILDVFQSGRGTHIIAKGFKNGGLISGNGTGTSDSIMASLGYAGGGSIRVSNGEYIVKASSVKDYGLGAMNAVNNGTATIGTSSGGTVYNIDMTINGGNANANDIAEQVMKKIKTISSQNNKSNKVHF